MRRLKSAAHPRSLVDWSADGDGVVTISMHDADGRNALSEQFVAALIDALSESSAPLTSKVIVLTGRKEVFCSGAPKSLLVELTEGTVLPTDILLPRVLLNTPLPIIAAMEGHAVGGGFALGLSADIVLIARQSRYGCNFIELGITPGMGTTRLLEQVLSPARARELLFTGELRRGTTYGDQDGFNYVLARNAVLPKAYDLAAQIADKPRLAVETLKRGLAERRLRAFEESLALEASMHGTVLADPATRRRILETYVE